MTQKKTLQIRITPELHEKLRVAALKTRPRVSMSCLCRYYLEDGLENELPKKDPIVSLENGGITLVPIEDIFHE